MLIRPHQIFNCLGCKEDRRTALAGHEACVPEAHTLKSMSLHDQPSCMLQVLADAAAIDAKYDAGESITPLCGLPLAVKDAIDVLG